MPICHTRKAVRITYASPVSHCTRQLRVFAASTRGSQQVLAVKWQCSPQPDDCREYYDEFNNRVLELRHARIATEFRLAVCLTTTSAGTGVSRSEGLPATGMGAFVVPSALCDLGQEVCAAARRLYPNARQAGRDIERSAESICAWAHCALRYAPGASDATTTASQALARGAGVCQDYSHLMIAACRALALPARYVSGYVPGQGLMHAWVEVLDGHEWQAWDPTHNGRTSPDCVFVACGRDFRDVEPLRGTYHGRSGALLEVRCHTRIVEG